MREYRGHYRIDGQEIDQPKRGGSYVDTHGEAHECCNFLEDNYGIVYGHVETWKGDENGYDAQIRIENLGADKNDTYIDGVNVIWIATHQEGGRRVIGWYKNARVYRERQRHNKNKYPTTQHERDKVGSYRITAKQEDIHLIIEDQRHLIINPSKKRKGFPGMNSIFYPSNYKENNELTEFLIDLNTEIDKTSRKATDSFCLVEETDSVEGSWDFEGKLQLKQHLEKERSKKLIKDFKNKLTNYSCSICNFSFESAYGALGYGFIEAHHTIPIATLTEQTKMSPFDLIAVCSNCHRMLHRSNPPLSAKQLQSLIRNYKK